MNTRLKRSLMAGATIVALGATGIGLASAATDTASGQSSLIDKIAAKFNIDKTQLTALFTADRQEHQAQMQADQAKRLAQAVTDGKLTQAQADYITTAQKDIEALRGTTDPGQETDAQRTAVKAKMDALRTWATTNNIDMQYVGRGGHGGPGGGGMRPDDTSSSTSSSSSSSSN